VNSQTTTFDLLPLENNNREDQSQITRNELLDFWNNKFGISPQLFEEYSFWEKGSGKIWAFKVKFSKSIPIEAMGIRFTTTNQKSWKPTTTAAQKFGHHATKNVLLLSPEQIWKFVQGQSFSIDWNGESGYVIVRGNLSDSDLQIGVGLYSRGVLHSQIPKSRQLHLH
tara:strand:- start:29552 stop:30055 length:504 start_codon:yes stop_codon:yes gene_type:complete